MNKTNFDRAGSETTDQYRYNPEIGHGRRRREPDKPEPPVTRPVHFDDSGKESESGFSTTTSLLPAEKSESTTESHREAAPPQPFAETRTPAAEPAPEAPLTADTAELAESSVTVELETDTADESFPDTAELTETRRTDERREAENPRTSTTPIAVPPPTAHENTDHPEEGMITAPAGTVTMMPGNTSDLPAEPGYSAVPPATGQTPAAPHPAGAMPSSGAAYGYTAGNVTYPVYPQGAQSYPVYGQPVKTKRGRWWIWLIAVALIAAVLGAGLYFLFFHDGGIVGDPVSRAHRQIEARINAFNTAFNRHDWDDFINCFEPDKRERMRQQIKPVEPMLAMFSEMLPELDVTIERIDYDPVTDPDRATATCRIQVSGGITAFMPDESLRPERETIELIRVKGKWYLYAEDTDFNMDDYLP